MTTTTIMTAFIVGLIFMAIMGAVCGYYTLKLILLIDKSRADRAKQKVDSATSQAIDERQQA